MGVRGRWEQDAALSGRFEFDVKVLYILTWAQWRAELTEFSADLRVADVFLIKSGHRKGRLCLIDRFTVRCTKCLKEMRGRI